MFLIDNSGNCWYFNRIRQDCTICSYVYKLYLHSCSHLLSLQISMDIATLLHRKLKPSMLVRQIMIIYILVSLLLDYGISYISCQIIHILDLLCYMYNTVDIPLFVLVCIQMHNESSRHVILRNHNTLAMCETYENGTLGDNVHCTSFMWDMIKINVKTKCTIPMIPHVLIKQFPTTLWFLD